MGGLLMHKMTEKILRKILHFLEGVIAIMTLIVMVGMVGYEVYKMLTVNGYFADVHNYLHNILTIVVGLEFVRMLIDMTPGNTLEVLIVAIARQVIVSHEDPISNVCCVLCIAGLFAIRRYLIPRKELSMEISELAPDVGLQDAYEPH
jgi:uncharacterized membrane protein (DUF373 family)